MAKHFQKVKLRHAESVQRRSAERKNPNYPRISLKSLFYVTRIYRKAVGARTIFFVIYRIYNSVLPSVTAILAGSAVTAIANAIVTRDFVPFIVLAAVLLGVQLVDIVLGTINGFLSLRTYQAVYIYVSKMVTTKYIQIPLRVR